MQHDCDMCDCEQWKSKMWAILRKLEYPEQVNTFRDGEFVMLSMYRGYVKELLEALDD